MPLFILKKSANIIFKINLEIFSFILIYAIYNNEDLIVLGGKDSYDECY